MLSYLKGVESRTSAAKHVVNTCTQKNNGKLVAKDCGCRARCGLDNAAHAVEMLMADARRDGKSADGPKRKGATSSARSLVNTLAKIVVAVAAWCQATPR